MTKRRVNHPAEVTLLLLTDADTGRKVGVNGGWVTTFTVGDRRGTTVFMNGDMLTVHEDFMTVIEGFLPRG